MKLIKTLLFLLFVIFPFGQLFKLSLTDFGYAEVNLNLIDLVVSALVGFWLLWLIKSRKKMNPPLLVKEIFIFISIAVFSLLVNAFRLTGRELLIACLYLARWLIYALFYLMTVNLKSSVSELRSKKLYLGLILWSVLVAIFGFIQLILWPDLRTFSVWDWDPHYYRLVSTFLDPGFTGLILVLGLLVLVISRSKELKKGKWGYWGVAGLVYLGLAFTYSRSSYLAFLVGMGVYSWLVKKPKIILLSLVVVLFTLVLIPRPVGEGGRLTRRYSIEARIENWQNSLMIARDHPLLGIGFNAYRYAKRDYRLLPENGWQQTHSGAGADSSLLLVMATTGVLGLVAYTMVWIKPLRLHWKKKEAGKIFCASLVAVLVHSVFANSLFYPWVMLWLWLVLAMADSST